MFVSRDVRTALDSAPMTHIGKSKEQLVPYGSWINTYHYVCTLQSKGIYGSVIVQ